MDYWDPSRDLRSQYPEFNKKIETICLIICGEIGASLNFKVSKAHVEIQSIDSTGPLYHLDMKEYTKIMHASVSKYAELYSLSF
ncbi:Hypothetical protein HVR_LOCUS400 [uncultured virus]|nr:Hypothetical protein HVR_LOCUS400 [uncultured virus]